MLASVSLRIWYWLRRYWFSSWSFRTKTNSLVNVGSFINAATVTHTVRVTISTCSGGTPDAATYWRIWMTRASWGCITYDAVMRLPWVAAGLVVAAIAVGTSSQAEQGSAKLTIKAEGDALEFRTLGLSPSAFLVPAGGARIFQNLKPGRYVVVQAPPLPGRGLRMQCSDGESMNQYDLVAGDDLVCTFTSEDPP